MPPSESAPHGIANSHQDRMALRRAELYAQVQNSLSRTPAIVLEIGCGHGHFLVAFAAANPAKSCVGIDLASDRIARAEKKRTRAELTNLHFFRADARLFVEVLDSTVKLSDIFILFPDPWPKLRHHKHRLIQPAFLDALAEKAGWGAHLFFRTDYAPYFAAAKNTISNHPRWQLVDDPWLFEHETVFQHRAPSYQSFVARLRPAGA